MRYRGKIFLNSIHKGYPSGEDCRMEKGKKNMKGKCKYPPLYILQLM
jgi:hypothetical protein